MTKFEDSAVAFLSEVFSKLKKVRLAPDFPSSKKIPKRCIQIFVLRLDREWIFSPAVARRQKVPQLTNRNTVTE